MKGSYQDQRFLDESREAKGYAPDTAMVEDEANRKLRFAVAGRDTWTKRKKSQWEWEFVFEEVDAASTRVSISYRYSFLLAVLGAGTVRHQASNEACENVRMLMALEAGVAAARRQASSGALLRRSQGRVRGTVSDRTRRAQQDRSARHDRAMSFRP